ncbi:MAG: MarR family transcriptional regulator [Caulobacteraceae bacterium]
MSVAESEDPAALIARAVLRLGRRLCGARPEKSVNLSTLALLTTLHRRGPMSAVQLAREERLQPQSLTRLLAAMTREGLIARETDPADRRAHVIQITREGRSVVARDLAARRAWLDQAMDMALTPEEREQLTQAAALMLKVAGQEPEAARAFRRVEGPAVGQAGEASVIPGVYYEDARAGMAWLKAALGFETAEAWEGAGGRIAFARMVFCGSPLFVSSRSRNTAWSAVGVSAIALVCPDAADVARRHALAEAAGADFIRPLHRSVSPAFPDGVQQFDVRDPEGHLWTVSEYRPGRGRASPP